MSDERYKLGFKKYFDAIEASGKPVLEFQIRKRLEQETRRLQKSLFPLLLVIGVRLIIDSFLDQVIYSQQAGWISAGLTVAMGLLMLIYLMLAVSAKNKIPVDNAYTIAYWASYLRHRIRTFWLLFLAILLGSGALILITYDQAGSIFVQIVMAFIVGCAGLFLLRSYLYSDYKFYLKEAERHLDI